MTSQKWLSCFPRVVLISALVFSGCNPEKSDQQKTETINPAEKTETEQIPQQKQSVDSKTEHKEIGEASWYGPGFHGQETASGDTFDQKGLTAAHPSLPLGTKAEVTNLENKKKVEVTINDRGPYAKDRVIDLSSAAAKKLDMKKEGVAKVKITAKNTKKKTKKKTRKKKKRLQPRNSKIAKNP